MNNLQELNILAFRQAIDALFVQSISEEATRKVLATCNQWWKICANLGLCVNSFYLVRRCCKSWTQDIYEASIISNNRVITSWVLKLRAIEQLQFYLIVILILPVDLLRDFNDESVILRWHFRSIFSFQFFSIKASNNINKMLFNDSKWSIIECFQSRVIEIVLCAHRYVEHSQLSVIQRNDLLTETIQEIQHGRDNHVVVPLV